MATLVAMMTLSSAAFAERPSKCIIKLKYKVAREGNRQYLWCLDEWQEDGHGYFYTTRRYSIRDVSAQECQDLADSSIGETARLKFNSLPQVGFTVVDVDRDPYECDATVVGISKIKYKPAKFDK